MLKNVPPILSPRLLMVLARMGHGDEICIGDANFPGHTLGRRVIRMDGHGVPEILDAVLAMIPLDRHDEHSVLLMQVMPGDPVETPIWDRYKEIVARHDPRGAACFAEIERFAFYRRVREQSVAVVMSGEKALYANIILKKGVL